MQTILLLFPFSRGVIAAALDSVEVFSAIQELQQRQLKYRQVQGRCLQRTDQFTHVRLDGLP